MFVAVQRFINNARQRRRTWASKVVAILTFNQLKDPYLLKRRKLSQVGRAYANKD